MSLKEICIAEHTFYSESLGLWALSIIQNSKYLGNTTFWKLDLFLTSGEGRETPTLLGHLERANVFYSYLEFQTMETVHEPSDSSEAFRYKMLMFTHCSVANIGKC
jgi:hypothetical protein